MRAAPMSSIKIQKQNNKYKNKATEMYIKNTIGLLVLVLATVAQTSWAQHTHDKHFGHKGYTIAKPWSDTPVSCPSGPNVKVYFDQTWINCSCTTMGPIVVSESDEVIDATTVTVGASVTAKTALMLKMIAEAAFTCTANKSWTASKKHNIGTVMTVSLTKCSAGQLTTTADEYSSSGSVVGADCKYECNIHGIAYCNKGLSMAEGFGVKNKETVWLPRPDKITDKCPNCSTNCNPGG